MVYAFYNKADEELTISTNLLAMVELTGLKYHILRDRLANGNEKIKTEEFILFKKQPIKGKQQVSEKAQKARAAKQSSKAESNPPPEQGGFTNDLF